MKSLNVQHDLKLKQKADGELVPQPYDFNVEFFVPKLFDHLEEYTYMVDVQCFDS